VSVATSRAPSGVITIDGEPFFLATDEKAVPFWKPRQEPTQEGDPMVAQRKRFNDWSRGLGDSRGVYRGAVEYAEYAYLGVQGRILPAPLITEIVTGHSSTVMDIVEVTVPANRIISLGGTTAKEINPLDHTVAATGTLTGGALSGQLFDDQLAIAVGDTTDYYIRKADGTYVQNTISKKARCFGLSGPDLVRGFDNTWSKCSADTPNITSVNNWGTEYGIGDLSGKVNQVFSHNRWDYALKDEGLYTFDQATSEEANVLTDLEAFKSAENRAFGKWYSHIFVCSLAGLYRFVQQGAARTVGIEELGLNESELADVYPTAFAAFGSQFYVAYFNGTTTWICVGRRAADGDASGGSPFTITSVIDKFTGECRAMKISDLPTRTELFYGAGVNVRYFPLAADGQPYTYQTDHTAIVRFSPTDFDSPMTIKQFRSIECKGRNATANQAVTFKAGFDGGAENAVGNAIEAFAAQYAQRFWTRGVNDSGRVFQLIAEMTTDSPTVPVEIRDVVVDYEERPAMVSGAVVGLRFRDFDSEGDVSSRNTAIEQYRLLEGYFDGPIVEVTDPWGETYPARFYNYRQYGISQDVVTEQFRGEDPQMTAIVVIRKLAYA
jgi:hypothetical protein